MRKQHYKPETYTASKSVGYLVKRAHLLCRNSLEAALEKNGLTYMQWVSLMYLRDGLAFNPRDLCADFRIDSGALTRLIDQLEERGWVERHRSREDRRTVELRLTDSGRKAIEAQIPLVVDRLNCALRNFTRTEVTDLTRLLVKLIEGIETGPEVTQAEEKA
jgi:DNA-binding MarR family transcriptional regulator